MVRHWFSLFAVLAVAVLMVATDASQSRERRLARRARRNSGDQVANSPMPSGPYYYDAASGQFVLVSPEEGTMAYAPAGGRFALYPPDSQGTRALPVRLEVRIHPDAELWIEGTKTVQTGDLREFISPPVQPGRSYTYEMKVKWMDNGQERTQNRTIKVEPGQMVRVDLSRASEEKE